MLDNFNINVTHFVPTPVPETGGGAPDTGFFSGITSAADFVSHNSAIIAIIISLIVTALAVFLLRRKLFSNKRLAILPSLAIFAFMAGFSYAAYTTINSVEAIKDIVANTTIDITMNPEQEATKTGVATAEVTLSPEELEDATVGYTVYAYLGTTTDTGLHSTNGDTISATDTNVSDPEDLPNNTYAIYDIENNTYTAISTDEEHPTKVYFTDQNSTEGSTFNVYYAAKVNNTLPEGNYAYDELAQQLTYVTKANPITFDMAYAAAGKTKDATSGLYKMQDMTPNICSAVTKGENITTQLIDARDKKIYWVTKLADDNCWMTQNLDLDITTDGLSATDTDITTDWNSTSTYKPKATLTDASQYTDDSDTSTSSWDAGDYYYLNKSTSGIDCGTGKTTYSGCENFGTSGDTHYHVGNRYAWNTATAGTGGTKTSGQAEGSICPKGWRLPTGGSSGELQALANATGGPGASTVSNWTGAPYYFVRGGNLWYDALKLSYAGNGGYYWSSTPHSLSYAAHALGFFGSSVVDPASGGTRAIGRSVRCVAR